MLIRKFISLLGGISIEPASRFNFITFGRITSGPRDGAAHIPNGIFCCSISMSGAFFLDIGMRGTKKYYAQKPLTRLTNFGTSLNASISLFSSSVDLVDKL